MFYTYVLRSKRDGKWYTGSTGNLRKRFKEHTDNKIFSTKNRGPFELIYYEACMNAQDARLREKYLKSGMGKSYIRNRLKRFLSLTGFTIIETMIAMAILLIALASISMVYISGSRLTYAGASQIDLQRKAQTVGANVTRWIRPASSVEIINNGDGLQIMIPSLDISTLSYTYTTSQIYYDNGDFYYDSDINDENPANLVSSNIYKSRDTVFSKLGENIVNVNFGVESSYQHGPTYPVVASLKIKIRNVAD